jgi:hypothetical protein
MKDGFRKASSADRLHHEKSGIARGARTDGDTEGSLIGLTTASLEKFGPVGIDPKDFPNSNDHKGEVRSSADRSSTLV